MEFGGRGGHHSSIHSCMDKFDILLVWRGGLLNFILAQSHDISLNSVGRIGNGRR